MNSRYNRTELGEMKAAQGKYLFCRAAHIPPTEAARNGAPIGMRILFIPAMRAEA